MGISKKILYFQNIFFWKSWGKSFYKNQSLWGLSILWVHIGNIKFNLKKIEFKLKKTSCYCFYPEKKTPVHFGSPNLLYSSNLNLIGIRTQTQNPNLKT